MKTRTIRITRKIELTRSVLVEVPASLALSEIESAVNDEANVFNYLDYDILEDSELARDPKFIGGLGCEFSYDELEGEAEQTADLRLVEGGAWEEALMNDELIPATS